MKVKEKFFFQITLPYLTLIYDKVRCIVNMDKESWEGEGGLNIDTSKFIAYGKGVKS